MSAHRLTSFVILLALCPSLSAQTPQASMAGPRFLPGVAGDMMQLQDDRRRFLVEVYGLSGPDLEKVMQALSTQLPAQQSYQDRIAKTLDRTELALIIINNDTTTSEADRANRRLRFERQQNEYHRKAPLSLTNVMRIADGLVPSDRAAAARQKLLTMFGAPPRDAAGQLDPAKLDDLMVKLAPVKKRADLPPPAPREPPPVPIAQASLPQPAHSVGDGHDHSPQPAQAAPPQPAPPKAVMAAPPSAPPKVYPPAPPVTEWEKSMQSIVAKYRFADPQRQVAERIYKHCSERAKHHSEKCKAELDAAEKMSGDERLKALAKVNQPLNTYYGEMTERLEAVATVEQQQIAAPPAPAASAVKH